MENKAIKCSQCDKTAIFAVSPNKIPLCLDCYHKFQQTMEIQNRLLKEEMNYITDQIESTVGLHGILPRHQISQPLFHQGPLTFNNIKVDRSTIGAINTGELENIDINITHINKTGSKELVEALKEFTQAVIEEIKLNESQKNQIIEQLSFLTSQINTPKDNRKISIIKMVLLTIKNSITTLAGLTSLWEKLYPLLQKNLS